MSRACHHCSGDHETRDHVASMLSERRNQILQGMFQTREGRAGSWIQTFTGRSFYPLDPLADEVAIEDIAHGLAMVCRYGGHTRKFYSVAEHSIACSYYVEPQFALHALLHDATEAYIGDMVRPLKNDPSMLEFRQIEALVEVAIAERFDIEWTLEARTAVKVVDDRIIVDEVNALMADPSFLALHYPDLLPLGWEPRTFPPEGAEHWFLSRFNDLTIGR